MPRGKTATRVTGGASLLAAMAMAAALTGAAFFTVQQASCADPGSYVRHDDHIELIGGCVDLSELPGAKPARIQDGTSFGSGPGTYRP